MVSCNFDSWDLIYSGALVAPFLFTKFSVLVLKNLGKTAVLLLLPFYLGSNTSKEAFSGVLPCEEAYTGIVYHYASVVWREGRGEILEGKLSIVSALRNGARGYKAGKLDPELVELVAEELKNPVRHQYKHWINLELATDKKQLKIAMKAIKENKALKIGRHWFY